MDGNAGVRWYILWFNEGEGFHSLVLLGFVDLDLVNMNKYFNWILNLGKITPFWYKLAVLISFISELSNRKKSWIL